MLDHEALDKNFRFIGLEVIKQVDGALRMLDEPDPGLIRRIRTRDDYIDHLKSIIENTAFAHLGRFGSLTKETIDTIRSLNVVTANLERIADHAVNVALQIEHLEDPAFIHRYSYRPFFEKILGALRTVQHAFASRDATQALRLCESEGELDELYRQRFATILDEMKSRESPAELVTSLLIFHYLERMGDCLLNIGEAILFLSTGERLKFNQIQSLRAAISAERDATGRRPPDVEDLAIEGIWGTRGGTSIGKLREHGEPPGPGRDAEVIYKAGDAEKLRKEKQNIERWRELAPDLPPRVMGYRETDAGATLLIEYLTGNTLQEIVLYHEDTLVDQALHALQNVLRDIWPRTRKDETVRTGFLAQLQKRLDDIYAVHPDFAGRQRHIGSLRLPGFEDLLRENLDLDDRLPAPFSVFGHGDFNLDNIIFEPGSGDIHFIDLHRSATMDYAQDISVLIVSNFRTPVFEENIRKRLGRVMLSIYHFAREFARQQNDPTFEARLALGLVRSFMTSTRFELHQPFAEQMFQRARFLLERLAAHREHGWDTFTLPEEALVD